LPGAGNLLVFDNPGEAGYPPQPLAVLPGSRVLEIDPVKKQIVWEYVSPYFGPPPFGGNAASSNYVYRAQPVPYEWVPEGTPHAQDVVHIIDILPTTLDLLGLKAPEQIRGIKQDTIEGTSLAYSIDDAKAASRHTVQYYYIFGSRANYQDGWKAALPYPNGLVAGIPNSNKPFDENAWQLYNLNEDYTERVDLAKKYPDRVAKLRALFEEQAQEHHPYPLITWDDVLNARIHRTTDSKSVDEQIQKLQRHSGN
jgi:hypothetical protein